MENKDKKTTVETKNTNVLSNWEVKPRVYRLKGASVNLASKFIQTRSSKKKALHHFDGKKNRILRFAENFDTPFEDEQDSTAILRNIRFKNGTLYTEENEIGKQQFLELHPDFNRKWYLVDKEKDAQDEMLFLDLEFEAMKIARESGYEIIEAVMRAYIGSSIDEMSSAEVKKDALLFAKRNPRAFLELVNDDDLQLRNVAVKSFEYGYLKLNAEGTQVLRTDTKAKIIDIGFDENHFTKLSQFFKKDDGLALYKSLVKKLK